MSTPVSTRKRSSSTTGGERPTKKARTEAVEDKPAAQPDAALDVLHGEPEDEKEEKGRILSIPFIALPSECPWPLFVSRLTFPYLSSTSP